MKKAQSWKFFKLSKEILIMLKFFRYDAILKPLNRNSKIINAIKIIIIMKEIKFSFWMEIGVLDLLTELFLFWFKKFSFLRIFG